MHKPIQQRPGNRPRAATTLTDFFVTDDFCFYRNYCFPRTPPGTFRSIVLYDRSCPICRNEMHRLKQRDPHHRLTLIDISAAHFDPGYWGFQPEKLSAALHVRTSDGDWLIGMPAIRHVYAQVGLGWVMAASGWPLLSKLADRLYAGVAPNRQLISRWMGLQADIRCNEQLCDSDNPAAVTTPEAPRHD